MVVSNGGDKSRFFLVLSSQGYLMVALEGIQETHSRVSHGQIQQSVYSRHRERILRVGLIQVCEVHVDPPFPTLLLHHDCVGQPFGVEYLLDSPRFLQFCDLLSHDVCMLFRRSPRRLLLRRYGRANIKVMADEIWVNPRAS